MQLRQLAAPLALLLGAAGMPVTGAVANSVPRSWSIYAVKLSQELQERLADNENVAATRLHAFLDDQATKQPAKNPPAPVLRIWIGRSGAITRAQFVSLGDAQADRDLRQLITTGRFDAPPRNLRQPLVLRLSLTYPS